MNTLLESLSTEKVRAIHKQLCIQEFTWTWLHISLVFFLISKILLFQVFDFTVIDLTSETDEIPDIIALEEEDASDHSHANGPESSQGKTLNN